MVREWMTHVFCCGTGIQTLKSLLVWIWNTVHSVADWMNSLNGYEQMETASGTGMLHFKQVYTNQQFDFFFFASWFLCKKTGENKSTWNIQTYACPVWACFVEQLETRINSHDVMQMPYTGYGQSHWNWCDWTIRCLMWYPHAWVNLRLIYVQPGLIRFCGIWCCCGRIECTWKVYYNDVCCFDEIFNW